MQTRARSCFRRSTLLTRTSLSVLVLALCVLTSSALLAQDRLAASGRGINIEDIDHSVAPGDDFYRFANGRWLARTQIPPERGFIDRSTSLVELANRRVAQIIEESVAANPLANTNARKIADLYRSYMSEETIEAKGLEPLQPELKKIAAIRNKRQLARALGETLRSDVDPLNVGITHTPNIFGFSLDPGFDDPYHYTAHLLPGGMELWSPEYYLSDEPRTKEICAKYQAHVAAMLRLLGFTNPDKRAARVIELERSIAEKHRLGTADDITKGNHTWGHADFATKAPGLNWPEFFRGAGLSKRSSFTVWQPAAISGETTLVASIPLEHWKDWLAYHLIEDYSDALPRALNDESFAFFSETFNGTKQRRRRSERAIELVNAALGDAVGQIYAQKYFSPDLKAQVETMVANIVAAFRKRIDELTWMDTSTKKEAIAKLNALHIGIGYPERWRDYSGLQIKPDDVFGNLRRAGLFHYRRDIKRLGTVVDKDEWPIAPQTFNALNLPLRNALVFPAAILELFDPQAPAANYGAIGSMVGHEISHSFDPNGSRFDSQGRLRNWWAPADLKHYQEAAQRLAEQYNRYRPFSDMPLNGWQTLGENVADLTGISVAYDAYHASFAGHTNLKTDELSGDQEFFVAYGQNLAQKRREPLLRQIMLIDSHSPNEYRADTVRNLDTWYSAFGVPPTAKLYLAPTERVRIW